jgi:hypothetical protein
VAVPGARSVYKNGKLVAFNGKVVRS